MSLIVLKFGGTSLGSVERIQGAAVRVAREVAKGCQPVVVVSAMGHSTDRLVDMANEITSRPDPREMDMLMSTGEQISMALLAMALQQLGVGAVSMTGWQAGIMTENVHTRARILSIQKENILKHVDQGKVVVVAGFQGVTEDGEITTIGRGGSDTTAVALAAALGAERCDIYTDVPGVFTADPRIVPLARRLPHVSYDEMLELASMGAAVLHPRAVECAKKYGVALSVRSSFGEGEGTRVREGAFCDETFTVCGVAHEENVAKITVSGMGNGAHSIAALSAALCAAHIPYHDLTVQGPGEIAFSTYSEHTDCVREMLHEHQDYWHFSSLLCEQNLAKVSVVGAGTGSDPEVVAELFRSLSEADIDIKMVSTSEMKVSCLVPQPSMVEALHTLHSVFGLDRVTEAVLAP